MDPIRTQLPFTGVMTSNIGGRSENQDSCGYSDTSRGLLLVVCDGMGGGPGGKTASSLAAGTIVAYIQQQAAEKPGETSADNEAMLRDAVQAANHALRQKIVECPELNGMGTTVTAVLLTPTGAILAHVGDSRIYQLRRNKIVYRTSDHSLVAEMVRAGQQTEEQARLASNSNIITRALGIKDEVKVDTVTVPYHRGDRFVLCTDGIWGAMPQPELVRTLTENSSPENTVEVLNLKVENAGQQFKGGHHDNYTVIIAVAQADSVAPAKVTASTVTAKTAEGSATPQSPVNVPDAPKAPQTGPRDFKRLLRKTDSRILALIITGLIITPIIVYFLLNIPKNIEDNPTPAPDPSETAKVDSTANVTTTSDTEEPFAEEDTNPTPPETGHAQTVTTTTVTTPTHDVANTDSASTAPESAASATPDELRKKLQALNNIKDTINRISSKFDQLDKKLRDSKLNPHKQKKDPKWVDIDNIIDFLNRTIEQIRPNVVKYLTDNDYKLIYGEPGDRNTPEVLNSRYPGLKGQFENKALKNPKTYESEDPKEPFLRYQVITEELRLLKESIDNQIKAIQEQLNE